MSGKHETRVLVRDLKKAPVGDTTWFEEKSSQALAGRCLLDAIEYLRTNQKLPGRFWHVVNAHCIRLVHRCLSDGAVNQPAMLHRLKSKIDQICELLSDNRQTDIPYYGDDFWDWASVVNAFSEVQTSSEAARKVFPNERDSLLRSAKEHVDGTLSIGQPGREWFGPAVPALLHRVLRKFVEDRPDGEAILTRLKAQALSEVVDGKYQDREVPEPQVPWHYGQVVALFPQEALAQVARIKDFNWLKSHLEKHERVYALARVLQGAYACDDDKTAKTALRELYKDEDAARPLGQGLVGETVKGSLNVLEAIWPTLDAGDKAKVGQMVAALFYEYKKANTIGLLVCIKVEHDALKEELRAIEATSSTKGDATIVDHADFHAVISQAKSGADTARAVEAMARDHGVKCIIMSGIAGSLGTNKTVGGVTKFVGPDLGDVVIATSLAPFDLRNKVRETIENVSVPFKQRTWDTLPTDPQLFRLAHEIAEDRSSDFQKIYEGLTVTGTGIKDNPVEKEKILAQCPGGLAIEEEGYLLGLVCINLGVPYLNIRGISDRADGGKEQQGKDKRKEASEQKSAAKAAGRLGAAVALQFARSIQM
jgi:nucleoside phosphorylase